MANLQRILGTLMSTGLGGRSRRGPSFGRSALAGGLLGRASGGSMTRGAGLGMLATLAYQAYQRHQAGSGTETRDAATPAGADAGPDDRKALLLIRAMVAAANADGRIDADERQRILGKLEEAGVDQDDRAFVEHEMASPVALDALLRDVDGEEEAEQFYLASELAIDADTDAERSYLHYLADRLELSRERVEELNRVAA